MICSAIKTLGCAIAVGLLFKLAAFAASPACAADHAQTNGDACVFVSRPPLRPDATEEQMRAWKEAMSNFDQRACPLILNNSTNGSGRLSRDRQPPSIFRDGAPQLSNGALPIPNGSEHRE